MLKNVHNLERKEAFYKLAALGNFPSVLSGLVMGGAHFSLPALSCSPNNHPSPALPSTQETSSPLSPQESRSQAENLCVPSWGLPSHGTTPGPVPLPPEVAKAGLEPSDSSSSWNLCPAPGPAACLPSRRARPLLLLSEGPRVLLESRGPAGEGAGGAELTASASALPSPLLV